MSQLSDFEAKCAVIALHLGEQRSVVRRVLDPNLCKGTRGDVLERFLGLLEALASEKPKREEPAADPLLRLWRIRSQERALSLPCPDLEFTPNEGGLAFKAMAARLCVYWDGHPLEHQVHVSLHAQVRAKGRRRNRSLEQKAGAWRRWYEVARGLHEG